MTESTGKPVCSICIANYNGEKILEDCLASVFTQVGGFDVEVIVHDDASTDGSLTVLARHPGVIVIPSSENVGFCIANNRMVERARGEYVLLLNNDAALFPDGLHALLQEARALEGESILSLPQYDWNTGDLVDRGCFFDSFYNPVPNLARSRADVAMVLGACLFTPRHFWIELGGFPEWMESLAEDAYLCCLARLRGAHVRVAAESGYRHRQGKSFGGNRVDEGRLSTTYRRRALSERNKIAVMVICTPTAWVRPLLAFHFVLLAIEGAALALMKRDARIWREIYAPALGYAMRAPGNLRTQRVAAQQSRRISLRTYLGAFTWMPRKLVLWRRHGVPRVS